MLRTMFYALSVLFLFCGLNFGVLLGIFWSDMASATRITLFVGTVGSFILFWLLHALAMSFEPSSQNDREQIADYDDGPYNGLPGIYPQGEQPLLAAQLEVQSELLTVEQYLNMLRGDVVIFGLPEKHLGTLAMDHRLGGRARALSQRADLTITEMLDLRLARRQLLRQEARDAAERQSSKLPSLALPYGTSTKSDRGIHVPYRTGTEG